MQQFCSRCKYHINYHTDPEEAMYEDVNCNLICGGKELEASWWSIIEEAGGYNVMDETMWQ